MPSHVVVPHTAVSREALEGLVEEFITREGTDYGHTEHTLDQKRASVLAQLTRGEVAIVFDLEAESTTLVTRDDLRRLDLQSDPEEA